jgi:hypothetical protein
MMVFFGVLHCLKSKFFEAFLTFPTSFPYNVFQWFLIQIKYKIFLTLVPTTSLIYLLVSFNIVSKASTLNILVPPKYKQWWWSWVHVIKLCSKVCKGTFVLTKLAIIFWTIAYNQAGSFALHPCKEINIIIVFIILYWLWKDFFFD